MSPRALVIVLAVLSACNRRAPFKDFPAGPLDAVAGDASTPEVAPTAAATSASTSTSSSGPGDCVHRGAGSNFDVGPGKTFLSIGDVPFEKLKGGDTVRIFWRPQPYREKLMIGGIGAEGQPILICGVPGPKGEQPVIDGENATTRKQLDFPYDGHQPRGLVTIGHRHDEPYEITPKYITVQGLEIRNASPPYKFTDKAGNVKEYSAVAAGIFVQRGQHITIRSCTVTANNNGIFMGTMGGVELTTDVLIEGNHIYGNGSLATHFMHNVYNEGSNVTYQYNWFGAPRIGAGGVQGANIKERSAGVVIRYNWIEDGAHILDIVDAQEAMGSTVQMPAFHTTYVYGNVLVRGKPSGSLVHYGGDSGDFKNYRKGTLRFYDNTIVIKNADYKDWAWTSVFEIATNDERVDARNNIFYSQVAPTITRGVAMLGVRDEKVQGLISFAGNWVTDDWVGFTTNSGRYKVSAQVTGLDASKHGTNPGFVDPATDAFELAKNAAARGIGVSIAADFAPPEHVVRQQYTKHQAGRPRVLANPPTAGAFED